MSDCGDLISDLEFTREPERSYILPFIRLSDKVAVTCGFVYNDIEPTVVGRIKSIINEYCLVCEGHSLHSNIATFMRISEDHPYLLPRRSNLLRSSLSRYQSTGGREAIAGTSCLLPGGNKYFLTTDTDLSPSSLIRGNVVDTSHRLCSHAA